MFPIDGSFDYVPDPGFCGVDSFTYKANDGTCDSNVATVTITVFCSCYDEVWIDDDWTSQLEIDLFDPSLIWQYNAFNNIQDGVDTLCNCGNIYVIHCISIIADGVTIDGFEIRNGVNGIETEDGPFNYDCNNILIKNSEIHDNNENGIFIHNCYENYVLHNKIYFNPVGVRFEPSDERTIQLGTVNFNWFGIICENRNTAIANYNDGNIIDARWNWYIQDNGPDGLIEDAITGRIADGAGEYVYGDLNFDPWLGIDADIEVRNISGMEQTSFLVGELIIFDGSDSFHCDINGDYVDNVGYTWNLGDSNHQYVEQFGYVYSQPGIYVVELMTTAIDMDLDTEDNNLLRDFTQVVVTISARGEPLIAYADPEIFGNESDGYNGIVDKPIQFHGLATGGMPPYTWYWDFGDGTISTLQNPIKIYSNIGEYDVTLTVTDAQNNVAVDTTYVNVTERADDPVPVEIKDIKGGFGLSAKIINPTDKTIDWTIKIEGNIWYKGKTSGTVDKNSEISINTGLVLGFGNVKITITADETIEERNAFLFGPFILNLS
jgi:PKD repeat protein